MTNHVPSKYQQAVYEAVSKTNDNLLIEATAGSGKTSTIVEACVKNVPYQTKSVLFLAFNKIIAEALTLRLPHGIAACTMNSIGHRTYGRFNQTMRLDANKIYKIIKSLMIRMEEEKKDKTPEQQIEIDRRLAELKKGAYDIKQLVSRAKAHGIAPLGHAGLLEDTVSNWEKLIEHYDLSFPCDVDFAIDFSRKVLVASVNEQNIIDFDDQIYFPVILRLKPQQFDVVFVDEAQDISDIQRALIKKLIKSRGRIIFVGDSRQAIYGFRGADHNSLENIQKEFNCKRLPLSISYRCGKSIVEAAKVIVPEIEPFEKSSLGVVTHLEDRPWSSKLVKSGDFLICRTNAPLVKLCYQLLGEKIPAKILGKDIAKIVVNLVERLDAPDMSTLERRLDAWVNAEIAKRIAKDPDADVGYIYDKAEMVKAFIQHSGAKTPETLISAIEAMFSDEKGTVTLSSIHKVKGLETDRVLFLDTHKIPSRYATKPWQLISEQNLKYVGITRAKKELIFLQSDQFRRRNGGNAE